ncbi:MAG: integrase [Pseudomonadota bacterium]
MPKLTKYPRLRVHVRNGQNGRVWTNYYYDMRSEGVPDIALGRDRDEAILKWEELHLKKPRIKGTLEEAFLQWEQEKLPEYENVETQRGYRKSLKWLRKVFSTATWDATKLVHLVDYLKARKGKTQANREMALLSIIWNQARIWGMTTLPWPAAGMERSKWKNKEFAREFEVTDQIFELVHSVAEPMLKDCMDLASATGMRLTDCREVVLPANNVLRLKASKTGKKADFDLALSQVLPDLLARRRALFTTHLMLLSMPDGSPVTVAKLRGAYDRARVRAAVIAGIWNDDALIAEIREMVLRDMRKRAADLSEDDAGASELLQHSSVGLTRKHYRSKAAQLKPVR